LRYADGIPQNLRWIPRNQRPAIQHAIETQLPFQSQLETRNRKPLNATLDDIALWELRCGRKNQFRVIYRIDQAERIVEVLLIGVKQGNRLLVNGEEHEL